MIRKISYRAPSDCGPDRVGTQYNPLINMGIISYNLLHDIQFIFLYFDISSDSSGGTLSAEAASQTRGIEVLSS